LINSYKNSYPTDTFYSALTDIYNPPFATGIDTLVPGAYDFTSVFAGTPGKLPQTALFSSTDPFNLTSNGFVPASNSTLQSNPLFSLGFAASGYLVNNTYRATYLTDAGTPSTANGSSAVSTPPFTLPSTTPSTPLRKRLAQNDLRAYSPVAPVLLCGGANDPTVFFTANTSVMAARWGALGLLGSPATGNAVLDVEQGSTYTNWPYAAGFQGQFALSKANYTTAYGASGTAQAYHGTLVPPWCNKAAKLFFDLH
jgi:hypothetical protein